jgi:hypothetical protein
MKSQEKQLILRCKQSLRNYRSILELQLLQEQLKWEKKEKPLKGVSIYLKG